MSRSAMAGDVRGRGTGVNGHTVTALDMRASSRQSGTCPESVSLVRSRRPNQAEASGHAAESSFSLVALAIAAGVAAIIVLLLRPKPPQGPTRLPSSASPSLNARGMRALGEMLAARQTELQRWSTSGSIRCRSGSACR